MARSRASQALTRLDKRAISAELNVSVGTVELWRSGARRPTEDKQERMAEPPFNVPKAWWSEQALQAVTLGEVRDRTAVPQASSIESGRAVHLEQVNSMLAVCHQALSDAEDPSLDPRERAGIMRAAAPTAQLLSKLLGQVDLTELQIVRAPAFQQVVERIATALAPWPEALRAMVDELEKGSS